MERKKRIERGGLYNERSKKRRRKKQSKNIEQIRSHIETFKRTEFSQNYIVIRSFIVQFLIKYNTNETRTNLQNSKHDVAN